MTAVSTAFAEQGPGNWKPTTGIRHNDTVAGIVGPAGVSRTHGPFKGRPSLSIAPPHKPLPVRSHPLSNVLSRQHRASTNNAPSKPPREETNMWIMTLDGHVNSNHVIKISSDHSCEKSILHLVNGETAVVRKEQFDL